MGSEERSRRALNLLLNEARALKLEGVEWIHRSDATSVARKIDRLTDNRSSAIGDSAKPAHDSREGDLAQLAAEVAECRRCALWETRGNVVFGAGSDRARIFFVGEGPGEMEDRLGEPFVGRAGKLLTDMIGAIGLSRDEVYIGNIVKCRPPSNRDPEPAEARECVGYLKRQIELIEPELIVALGRVAMKWLLNYDGSLASARSRFHDCALAPESGARVLVSYHPAYLLRSPAVKVEAWRDLRLLMAELGLEAPSQKIKNENDGKR